MAAAKACIPTPMVVQAHANMADDASPVVQQWVIPQGVCGFAWVNIKPGNCGFAKWMVSQKLASKAYEGGVSHWVHKFGQSMELKEAYAQGFACVLNAHGIKAYAGSRMD
jgi:hypothetical protein